MAGRLPTLLRTGERCRLLLTLFALPVHAGQTACNDPDWHRPDHGQPSDRHPPDTSRRVVNGAERPLGPNSVACWRMHFLVLDGVRGIAILLVIIYQFGSSLDVLGFADSVLGFLRVGRCGGDVVFVLSECRWGSSVTDVTTHRWSPGQHLGARA